MRGLLLAIAVVLLAPAVARADRDAYAGGCYSVGGLAGAEQVRMQATDLGRYVLYRPDGTFVGPSGVVGAPVEWVAGDAGTLSAGTRTAGPVTPATGCAVYPEAALN